MYVLQSKGKAAKVHTYPYYTTTPAMDVVCYSCRAQLGLLGLGGCQFQNPSSSPSLSVSLLSVRVPLLFSSRRRPPPHPNRSLSCASLPTTYTDDDYDSVDAKRSGTTARGRRLLKLRQEKTKRQFDLLHNYPAWAKVMENACRDDAELRAVLGDSIGNPGLMRKRVEERVRKKGKDFRKSKTGSVLAFKVSFRNFNPIDSYIWFELYGPPSDRDVDLIGSVFQSWYVMGRLGAFNSSSLQLANASMEYNPLYDADKASKVMPSSFHDISDVEFQENWGRIWVDLGTSDYLAIDVLLNCLTVLSSEYLGIQQIVFGGRRMGDWEEGMENPEYGYKYFKI